ncbi:MAG: hypothetical protein ACLQM8_13285 [Limisphaerales bacterium]
MSAARQASDEAKRRKDSRLRQFSNGRSGFPLPANQQPSLQANTAECRVALTMRIVREVREGTEIAKMFAKTLSEAYGQPFDEKAFEARVAAADRGIAEGSDQPEFQ